jgi:SAM-dependent methyltransferase
MSFDWDDHYKSGGKSGDPADYAKSREWKKDIIRKYCDLKTESVLDVGCGDLQFWDGVLPTRYTGIDISRSIIAENRIRHPSMNFFAMDATIAMIAPSDAVICFDMLWHIIYDTDYECIMRNLKNNATKTLFIFTWSSNPTKDDLWAFIVSEICNIKRGGYQKYRDFLKIAMPIFGDDFELVETVQNPVWSFASMYVFRRKK